MTGTAPGAARAVPLLSSVFDPRGDAARSVTGLWWLMLGLGVVIVVAVWIVIGVGASRTAGSGDSSRRWIVGGGVAMPIIVVALVLVATIWTMRSTSRGASDDALRIDVTGHQWWWEVEYPQSGVVTANEIHIPAGEPVELRLRSADVIHSLWVPALAGKMDALPERTNVLVVEADEPGRFQARCAEFCGLQHTHMDMDVVAHHPQAFERWLEQRGRPAREPSTERQRRGLELVIDDQCAACHRVGGTDAVGDGGPDLTHIASRPAIAGGLLGSSAVDLATWIADPHGSKPGTLMPRVELTDDEVDDIASYLESLE